MTGASALVLSTDVRAALQELAQASGQVFTVRDGWGRMATVGNQRNGHSSVNGTAVNGTTVFGAAVTGAAVTGAAAAALEHAVPISLPDGRDGLISLEPRGSSWNATHDAWLQAGACLLSSTLRMDREVEGMAGEIARAFEDLFLLYSSSAALSAAEDPQAAYQAAISLVRKYIRRCPTAIYLREEAVNAFSLAAFDGPEEIWAEQVERSAASSENPLFGSHSLHRERSAPSELASVGIHSPRGGSLLCLPLCRGQGKEPCALGWLVLYEPDETRPFHISDWNTASALAAQAGLCIGRARHIEKQKHALLMGATRSLASAVDAKDRYTHGHSLRVTRYALSIGKELGCSSSELQALELGGLLHDVGKIGIPDRVLLKPGFLDEEEWTQMRRHPAIGASIVSEVPGLHPMVCEGIRSHHEWFNGWGYPDGLAGGNISLAGRILAVADCFDAMTSNRPYRKEMDSETALTNMLAVSGKQFDPDILVAFLDAYTLGRMPKAA